MPGRGVLARNRDLRVAVLGRSVSVLGDEVAVVALVLFAYDRGWGAAGVAAIFAATTLPWAVGGPYAGRLADRLDSRRVTAVPALVQAVVSAVVAAFLVAAPTSPVTVAVALAGVAAVNLAQAAGSAAWQALVPRLVSEEDVSRAVSATQVGGYLAGVAGPGLAGLLVASWGAGTALLLDAATFLLLAGAALAVRTVRRPEPGAGGDSAWAGVALIRRDRVFAPVLGGVLVVLLVIQVVLVVDVFLVRDVFGGDDRTYGFVMLLLAAASVGGAWLAGRASGVRAQAWGVVASLGLASGCAAAAGAAPSLALSVVAFAGVGVAFGALNVCVGAFTVSRTTDDVRGRVFAAVAGTTQLATLAGLGGAAALGAAVGPRAAFVGSGILGVVVTLAVAAAVARGLSTAGGDGTVTVTLPSEASDVVPQPATEPS